MQFAVIATLAVLHIFALENDLYWKFQWFDLMTHFLGGMWAALFFYWVGSSVGRASNLLLVIGGALLLGVAWEFLELAAGISNAPNYVSDTTGDLLMDILGAMFVAAAVKSILLVHRAKTL